VLSPTALDAGVALADAEAVGLALVLGGSDLALGATIIAGIPSAVHTTAIVRARRARSSEPIAPSPFRTRGPCCPGHRRVLSLHRQRALECDMKCFMPVWFLIHPRGLVLRREGADGVAIPSDEDAAAFGVDPRGGHALGSLDGEVAIAAALGEDVAVAAPFEIVDAFGLRGFYRALGEERFRLAGMANQLVDWASTHRFCGRCATPTERALDERAMRCPSCGLLAYPRISPAVIVLVRRGEEALLARGARFPLPFYSTLAGFVEVGENLEQTVGREIREEVGIEVKGIRYFGSQPWPFPHSLMIGFNAEWAGGDIVVEPKEIVDAKWFRADALPNVPPRLSIARRLIDAWLEEVAGR